MKSIILLLLIAVVPSFAAESAPSLDPDLQALAPFLGGWRGEFKQSTPDKPMIDVSRWERALNGKAVRTIHSINDGLYGGESIVTWDAEKKEIIYHYFTTAGFQSKGTMKVIGKTLECHETIIGNAGGTTEVKGLFELKDDGTMLSSSKYLREWTWQDGHEITYKRAADARPKFK
jgi:hypothetical protein